MGQAGLEDHLGGKVLGLSWFGLSGVSPIRKNLVYILTKGLGVETEKGIRQMDDENIKGLKKAIRRKVLQARDSMLPQERNRASLLVTERLLGHQWFYGSENLLCFASFGSEINTFEIISEGLKARKKVYLPKITKNGMEFYKIEALAELSPGHKSIPEPDGLSESFRYLEGEAFQTLMIMPGVAFDEMRRRVGYGKGCYDRYLSDKKELCLRTIAIGFSCQMVDDIPEDERDIRPYQLILA